MPCDGYLDDVAQGLAIRGDKILRLQGANSVSNLSIKMWKLPQSIFLFSAVHPDEGQGLSWADTHFPSQMLSCFHSAQGQGIPNRL